MKLILLSRVLEYCAASFRSRVRISTIQNPSIIYFTRERLAKAIFKMWEMEDAAKAGNANCTNEVVNNSKWVLKILSITTVILKKNRHCLLGEELCGSLLSSRLEL